MAAKGGHHQPLGDFSALNADVMSIVISKMVVVLRPAHHFREIPPPPAPHTLLFVCTAFRDALLALATSVTLTHPPRRALHLPALQCLIVHKGLAKTLTDVQLARLGALPSLQSLTLYNCVHLTPAGLLLLSRLPTLRRFDLRYTPGVTDTCVMSFSHFSSLEVVHLYGCPRVTAACIGALARHTALRRVTFDHDAGSAAWLNNSAVLRLSLLPALRRLVLPWAQRVTDAGLTPLSFLTNLSHLDLPACHKLSNEGMRALGALSHLAHLSLKVCTSLEAADLDHLSGLSRLTFLDLNECCALGPTAPRRIAAHHPRLHALDLSFTTASYSYDDLICLSRCRRLSDLRLRHAFCSCDAGMVALSALHSLRRLDLGYNLQSDGAIECLMNLDRLTALDLHRDAADGATTQVSDRGLYHLQLLVRLEDLALANAGAITGWPFEYMGFNLRRLDLSRCSSLRDAGLRDVARCCLLTELLLSDCGGIVGIGLRRLKPLSNLRRLDLSRCGGSRNDGVAHLAQAAPPALTLLDLSACPRVTNAALAHLGGGALCTLRTLRLEACRRVSDPGLMHLVGCAALEVLDLQWFRR